MSLTLGTYSDPIQRDIRLSDAKVTAISAPTAGSTQRGTAITITFTVQSYEVATCSITVKYSTDGETFSNATITGTVAALPIVTGKGVCPAG